MLVLPVPTLVKNSIDHAHCFVGDNLHLICWTRHSGSPTQHNPHDNSVKFKSCEISEFCERVESGLGRQLEASAESPEMRLWHSWAKLTKEREDSAGMTSYVVPKKVVLFSKCDRKSSGNQCFL